MGRQITLDLPHEVYEPLARAATAAGQPLEEWLLGRLRAETSPRPAPSEEEKAAALARLMRHVGVWDSGDPNSADNERIDADLARAYADTHDGEDD